MPDPQRFPDRLTMPLRAGTLARIDEAAALRGISRAAFLRLAIRLEINWEDQITGGTPPSKSYAEHGAVNLPSGWKARVEREAERSGMNRSEWVRRAIEEALEFGVER